MDALTLRAQIIEAVKQFPEGITCEALSAFMQRAIQPSYLSRLRSYGDVVVVRIERSSDGHGRVHFYGPAKPEPMRYARHVVQAREARAS